MQTFQYLKVFKEEIVSAVTVGTPNPGHTWSEMECNPDNMCFDADSKKLTVAGDVCLSGGVCLSQLKDNGVCGTKNGKYASTVPTATEACTSGTISNMTGSYSWTCVGDVGGTNASCSTVAATYTVVQFATVGTSSWIVPIGITLVDYLVVGGGGSGGGGNGGAGGGGAGGLLTGTNYGVIPGSLVSATVGAGGAAPSANTIGNNGSNSSFATFTAIGGGAGGLDGRNGLSGGSGGGSGWNTSAGSGTSGQGYAGGHGAAYTGGGGGGAGAAGGNGASYGGTGGIGLTLSISGTVVCYAGGGGGGSENSSGAGSASCGGGAGGTNSQAGFNATANTGGGGGGGGWSSTKGGAGGSGIVILRYINNH